MNHDMAVIINREGVWKLGAHHGKNMLVTKV